MDLIYKKAAIEDINSLTKSRIEVLRAANQLADDVDMSEVETQSYDYYKKALSDGTHTAYPVFDGDRFIGAGGISYQFHWKRQIWEGPSMKSLDL